MPPSNINIRQRTLFALDAFWAANAHPPTLRELAQQMGGKTISNLATYLREAADKGLVVKWGAGPHTTYVPHWVVEAIRQGASSQGALDRILSACLQDTCDRIAANNKVMA